MFDFFIGVLIIIIGFMVTWKSEWIFRNFGRVDWAEKHLSMEGGTRLFYRLIGLLIIIIGLLVISGIWSDILSGVAGFLVK